MAVTAHKLGPGVLTVGETGTLREFTSQITNARWTPSVDQEDPIDVLSGEQIADDPNITSVIAGTFLQEYGSEALVTWCWEHRGEVLPFSFQPRSDQQLAISGQCQVLPVEVGGDVKARNTTDFEFPLIGDPTFGTEPAV
ncbi:hypothetical protein [Brachybacterium massiliense]|uniref:hypothetical protein n=1 Tax=Brachybacterium massiliense TaxID=1755098 RepID=UPI000B3BC24B|nr:hypothetical protein [Brachybacterium massiliense]